MRKYFLTLPIAISQVVASSLIGSYSLDTDSSGTAWYTRATLDNSGNYLYISNGYSGFSTLNIKDISNIKEVSNIKDDYSSYITTNVKSLKLSNDGKFLYVGTTDVVLIYDVTDKLNPKFVTNYDINFKGDSTTNDYASDFEFSPNSKYVYVAVYNKNIAVFDATHENSQYLSKVVPSSYIQSLKVDKDKNRLYAGHKAGFDIFDISNQKELALLESINFDSSEIDNFRVKDIEIIDGYIIIAAGEDKSAIIFYDDESFAEVARYDLSYSDVDEISLSKDKTKLYISNRIENIILDISNLNNLKQVDKVTRSTNSVTLAFIPSLNEDKTISVEVSKDGTNYTPEVFVYDISKDNFSLDLSSGWQLVSFPGTLSVDISKNDYISNFYSYNNKTWSSSVDDIALGGGVWIKAVKNSTLEVDLSKYTSSSFTYKLESGWNLNGALFDFDVSDLDKECISGLYFYDKTKGWLTEEDIVVVNQNVGFWANVNKDCNITVTKSDIGSDVNEIGMINVGDDIQNDLYTIQYCKEINFADNRCKSYLQYSDLDGDGVIDSKELEYKSNPLMSDSDGDGINDYDEIYSGLSFYSPAIANIPKFYISSLENFDIEIWTTDEMSESVSLEESKEYTESVENSISKGGSETESHTSSTSVTLTVAQEVTVGSETSVTGSWSLALSQGYEYSKEKESNWDKTSTEAASNAIGQAVTNEQTKTVTYDGAKLLGTFTVTNLTPELEYDIEGLSFYIYLKDEYGNKTLVTTLYPEEYINNDGAISQHTLGGGDLISQKFSVTHKDEWIEIGKAFKMLQNPNSIVIEPNYHQINVNDEPISTNVQNKTVNVVIDYFESPTDNKYIYNGFRDAYPISKIDYDESKKNFTLTFKSIKEILEAYPYNYKFITSNQRIQKCRDTKDSNWKDCRDTKIQSKFDVCLDGVCEDGEVPTKSFETLIQIQNDRMENPNRLDDWIIYSDDIEKSELCDYFYPCMNFSEMSIKVNQIGGNVAFYNYKDSDNDGLEDRIEMKLQSNLYNDDSDGDGINDFKELIEFKTNINSATNYELVNDYNRTWEDAQTYAESKGGRLLVINSTDELDFVKSELTKQGTPLSRNTWIGGTPNGEENCKALTTDFSYYNASCNSTTHFIIEYGNTKEIGFNYEDPYIDTDGDGITDIEEKNKYFTSPDLIDTDGDGATDYEEIKEFFTNPNSEINYELIDNVSVDYESAKALAESRGGELLVVNSEDELTFVKTELGDLTVHTWLGATRTDTSSSDHTKGWYWSDGTMFTYDISPQGDDRNCLHFRPGYIYKDGWCDSGTLKNFIIEYGVDSTRINVSISDSDGDGLDSSNDPDDSNPDIDGDGLKDGEEVNTYNTDPENPDSDGDGLSDFKEVMHFGTDPNSAVNYKIVKDALSWSSAKTNAGLNNGHLVVINSEEEREYIFKHAGLSFESSQSYWIGLSKNDGESRYTGWDWVDGTEFRYTNWRYNQPDSDSNNCLMMRGSDSAWDDKSCSEVKYYIVEYGNKAIMKPSGVKVYETTTDSKFTLFGPKYTEDTFSTHATMLADNDTGYVYGVSRDASEIVTIQNAGYTHYYEESYLGDCSGRYCDSFNNDIDRFEVKGDCYVLFTDRWIDRTDGNMAMFVAPSGSSSDLSSNYFFDGSGSSSKINITGSFQNRIEGVALYCKEPYSK